MESFLINGVAIFLVALIGFFVFGSAFWTASLARGKQAGLIRIIGVLSTLLICGISIQALFPDAPAAEAEFKEVGDRLHFPEAGPGRLLFEAIAEDEEKAPGRAIMAKFLVSGETGKERISSRFVLFDARVGMEDEVAPEEEHRTEITVISSVGENSSIKMMEIRPEGLISIQVKWFPTGVDIHLMALLLLILALTGAFLEAAVPNGSARTFLTVALATGTALVWNIRYGILPDEKVLAYVAAIAWSFFEGAIVGSLLPGYLTRFVGEAEPEPEESALKADESALNTDESAPKSDESVPKVEERESGS